MGVEVVCGCYLRLFVNNMKLNPGKVIMGWSDQV